MTICFINTNMIESKYSTAKRQMSGMLSETLLGICHFILQKSSKGNELCKTCIEKKEDSRHLSG